VIFVQFTDGYPAGTPKDVLTGFVNATVMRWAARLAWQPTEWARCLSPMMLATSYGGCPPL
jgi:hypothetical protein